MKKTPSHSSPALLDSERIKFIKKTKSKKCVFDALTALLTKGQKEVTRNDVFDALIEREKLGSTSLTHGIAMPKAYLPISYPHAAALVIKKGLETGAADNQPTRVFLAIILPAITSPDITPESKKSNNKDNIENKKNIRYEKHRKLVKVLSHELILKGIPEKILASQSADLLADFINTIVDLKIQEAAKNKDKDEEKNNQNEDNKEIDKNSSKEKGEVRKEEESDAINTESILTTKESSPENIKKEIA